MGQMPESRSFASRLPLAGLAIDRDYLVRESEEAIEQLLEQPETRFIVINDAQAMVDEAGNLALLPRVENAETRIYLGRPIGGGPAYFAALVAERTGAEWAGLRELATNLDPLQAGLVAAAVGMANWHTATRYSPLSGAPTRPDKAGWVLRDSLSEAELFPRTDMAVIVGVVDGDDRLLLGRNAGWDTDRYSLLAGFVEPGESLEAAVVREVFEESGVRVTDPQYLGSQPWPFPASLMLGFLARVDPEHPTALAPDGVEIVDLRWFSRAELHAAAQGELRLPSTMTIARAIIEQWYGSPIEVAP
jgi:NAD+ diphosphatase